MSEEPEELEDNGFGETSRYAAHLDRGWSLLDRGDLGAARASAEQARELRPDAPDAAVLLGAIALADRDPQESLRWYDAAVELDPEYLEPYAAAAQVCLFDLGAHDEALRYCEEALELEHREPFETLDLQLLAAEAQLALGRFEAARARLEGVDETENLCAALKHGLEDGDTATEADDEAAESAVAFLHFDADGEPLEEEERTEQLQRLLQLSLRLGRLWLDLRAPERAVKLLRTVTRRFTAEPDAWHTLSEAEHVTGNPQAGCHAALRTHQLDAHLRPPKWAPSPALMHRKVVQVLGECTDPAFSGLVQREGPLIVLVQDAPAPELVMEGVDPRATALVLAARAPTELPGAKSTDPAELQVTGVALYRRNLLRLARTPEQFEQELRFSLLEELATFMQLDDERRAALDLPPLRPPPEEMPATKDEDADSPRKGSRRRKRVHN